LPLNRGARVGLLALLVLTILFASGVLFVKYQLEAFRADVAHRIEQRFGAHLTMGAISVNGLRGLRIQNLRLDLPLEQGPVLHIYAHDALINIQLNDLVYGHVTVERLALDDSEITLERPKDGLWYSIDELDLDEVIPFEVTQSAPFRITGAGCKFFIRNIIGGTGLDISDFSFDIARLVDASNLTASLSGLLRGDPRKRVSATLTLASIEDFDLRVTTDLITANDINVVLPADRPLVVEGAAHPTLWINGRPGRTLFVSLEAPFENVAVRDQPEFLEAASGAFAVSATYSTDQRQLAVMTAKADSNQLAGNVEGTITFTEDRPQFDLTMHARRIPLMEILQYSLKGQMEDIGKMDILLDEPHELEVRLTGTPEEPIIRGQTRAGAGRFEFTPIDDDLPPIQLTLRQIEGAWDSYTQQVGLEFDVADGAIAFEPLRLAAKGLQGHVTFKDDKVSLSPMNAQYKGNTIVGEGEYDLVSGDGRLKFEGTVAGLDETILADQFANTNLAGAVSVKGEAAKKGKNLIVEADLDATQAEVTYQWWFKKSAGLGTKAHVRAEIAPDSKASVEATGQVASSTLAATMTLTRNKRSDAGWSVDAIHATSDHLDVNTAATCGITPYRTTGGVASKAYFDFTRDHQDPMKTTQKFGGLIDDLALLPQVEGAAVPISGRGVDVAFELSTDKAGRSMATAQARISAQSLSVPPFGTTWLLPMTPPPGWPRVERAWTIEIDAVDAELPPWKGTELVARAYSNPHMAGFSAYQAKIGGGVLKGSYDAIRADNTYVSTAEWTDIPVQFFLRHLNLDDVLDGTISGKVNYNMDRDNPDTLAGTGHFEVSDGRFSADFLYTLLEGKVESNLSTIPPKLDFNRLAVDVDFAGDTVKTPVLKLESDTIQVDGVGQYIRDGDMDYVLKVAVEPDTAAQIPVMAENFNLQGHRLSNTDVDLTFHVSGPTFNPKGKVEELPPASVALVSGGLEVGKEVVNLIDFPRKVLRDLLKLGGGMVRGGRNRGTVERPSTP
jgi:hypothetical protein